MKNILSASIIPCVLFYSEGEFIAEFKSSLFDTKGYNFLSDSNFNFYRDLKAGWKRSPEGFATYTIYFNEYKIVFTGMKVKSISDVRGKNIGIPLYISEKIWLKIMFSTCSMFVKAIQNKNWIVFKTILMN